MQKFYIINKTKQLFKQWDSNFILLLFCILSVVLICFCLLHQIIGYRSECNQLSIQYEQRLDRCEELIDKLKEKGYLLEEKE